MKRILISLLLVAVGFVSAMLVEPYIPGTEVSDCVETSDYKFKNDVWLKFKKGEAADNKYYPLAAAYTNSYEFLIYRTLGWIKDSDCSDFVDGNAK